jgi:hypothetical protein
MSYTDKHIAPDGDYPDLDSWWEDAYVDSDPQQRAIVHGGFDAGILDTAGRVNGAAYDAAYPMVVAAEGEAHQLAPNTAKAWSSGGWYLTQPWIRVSNILFYLAANGNALVTQAAGEITLDGLAVVGAGNGDIGFYSTNNSYSVYYRNCLVYGCGGSGFFGDTPAACYFDNCGAINNGNNIGPAIFRSGFGFQRANHQLRNCYVLNNTGGYGVGFTHNSGLPGTPQISYTATFDGTATTWGGTGNLTGVSNSGHVANLASDWNMLAASSLAAAGTNLIADFGTDAVGASRPASGPWPLGPSQPQAGFKPWWARGSNSRPGRVYR